MTEQPNTDERDALKALLVSDGWRVFCQYIDQNWGDAACFKRIDAALDDKANAEEASYAAQQIRLTAKAVRSMIEWPTQRVQQLTGAKDERTFARWRRA